MTQAFLVLNAQYISFLIVLLMTLAMRILLVRKLHLKLKDVKFFFAFKIEFEY
jgi:hypothetical protein